MWTPKYLVDVVGVSIEASGFVLLLPYILPAAGTLVGGCKLLYLVLVAIQAPCDDLPAFLARHERFAWQGGATP